MKVLKARNVHEAFIMGTQHLRSSGIQRNSRNGPVLVYPTPVTTVYAQPTERVIFHPIRDANPFFHLFEALWMLAGRDDVKVPAMFAKHIATFSDNGSTLHGAYGYRWRTHFRDTQSRYDSDGLDQLTRIIKRLKADPDDRRCVLEMWDAEIDLDRQGKDVPCNTHAYFTIRRETMLGDFREPVGEDLFLDMTLCCRSNDIIWGAYGANAVHFSILMEYMAAGIGCKVGRLYQISNNFHAYVDVFEKQGVRYSHPNPYECNEVHPFPLVNTPLDEWNKDLLRFMWLLDQGKERHDPMQDPFFTTVAVPMLAAWGFWKLKDFSSAYKCINECAASDWRLAAGQWVQRREAKHRRAQDDGPNHEAE